MLNRFISMVDNQYKVLNIVVAEPSKFCRAFVANQIISERPYHNIVTVNKIEEVFSLMYAEMPIDLILFDVDSLAELNNISLISAILPEVAFISWSNCQHPEVIELLHRSKVNSFCLKDSSSSTIVSAVDSIATNPQILFVDERLKSCLPLLAN